MITTRSLLYLTAACAGIVSAGPAAAKRDFLNPDCGRTVTVTETCTVTATPTCSVETTTTVAPPTTTTTTSTTTTTTITKPTFSCLSDAFLIQKNTLYNVNLKTGARKVISTTVGGTKVSVNSLGYNTVENLMYGTQGNKLIRVLGDGKSEDVVTLPESPFLGGFDANGQFWYSTGGKTWGRVDLVPGSASYGKVVERGSSTLPAGVAGPADWAYTPAAPGYLYGLSIGKNGAPVLIRWSLTTKKWEVVYTATNLKANGFGAVMSTSDGIIYGSDNQSGGIFRFPINNPTGASRTATGPASPSNDGTRCFLQPDSRT